MNFLGLDIFELAVDLLLLNNADNVLNFIFFLLGVVLNLLSKLLLGLVSFRGFFLGCLWCIYNGSDELFPF